MARPNVSFGREARAELRFWACFGVVLALLAQALFPIQALALPNRDGSAFVLCTGDADRNAVQTDKVGHKKGMMGLKCADCVMASITAVQTGPAVVLPMRHHIAHAVFRPAASTSPIQARAPPRPHSCGPPSRI